jgi:hypothetical protein
MGNSETETFAVLKGSVDFKELTLNPRQPCGQWQISTFRIA